MHLLGKEDNCSGLITQVTEEEMANAVKRVNPLWAVLRAVSKFKQLTSNSQLNLAPSATTQLTKGHTNTNSTAQSESR
jgi:hypothetical protein